MRNLNGDELSLVSGGGGYYASFEATLSNILNEADVSVLAIDDIVEDVNILNERGD